MNRFLKRVLTGTMAAVIGLGLSVPAYADGNENGGSGGGGTYDIPTGTSNVETGIISSAITGSQTSADATKKGYDSGKKAESTDKSTGTKKTYPEGINPRNMSSGGISANYGTICVNWRGYRVHMGACTTFEQGRYYYNTTTGVVSYNVALPKFTLDYAYKTDATRVTGKNSVSGNPGVTCAATTSSVSGGITTTNTFRSMSYSVKYITYTSKGNLGGSSTYDTYSAHSYSTYGSAAEVLTQAQQEASAAYSQAKDRTAQWKAAGYKYDSESSAGKTKIGCYYNTKMTGKATAWFGSAKCVVGYTVNVIDERTGQTVATKSKKTAYGNNPTIDNCKGTLLDKISVADLVPDSFSRYKYERILTYDNPDVNYSPTSGWSLTNTLKNTSTQKNIFYIRATCNADWNGISTTPYTDTVSRNGSSYTLTYTQQDCASGAGESTTQCAMPGQGNSNTGVLVSNAIIDYNTATNTVTNDGKVTLVRNGVEQKLTFTIPKVGVTEAYKAYFSGNLPKNLVISNSNIAKNVDGTPWNNNTDVRNGVPANKANLADFVVKRTGDSSWIAKITNDSSITSFTGGEKYYIYNVASNAVNTISIASRWESTEGKPTVLRSDYTVSGQFPYKKWTVTALGPNGVPSSTATTIAYSASTLRCVSGPTEVNTVRSVS